MKNPISVSFLVTEPDFVDFKTAAAKACVKKSEIYLLRVTGCVLIFTALVLCAFYSGPFGRNALYILIAAAGAVLGAFHDLTIHCLVRRQAASFYEENKEKFGAQNT
ncbi:MAG TPA: hypothetical protein VHR42_02000 [Clostridia bacterium]|nr:hypothetical protein [Clostridia bacterium]